LSLTFHTDNFFCFFSAFFQCDVISLTNEAHFFFFFFFLAKKKSPKGAQFYVRFELLGGKGKRQKESETGPLLRVGWWASRVELS